MARGTMHAPKSAATRHRHNAPTHGEMVVRPDGLKRGPDLPKDYGADVARWYETWRTSPQAALFEDTDWLRLQMLAPIVEMYFLRPGAAALSEIRMSEERLGATITDRQRARIKIDRSPVGVDAEVRNIATARDSLRARAAREAE